MKSMSCTPTLFANYILKRHCIKFGVARIDSRYIEFSGVHTLGDNSAFVNPAGQLLLPGGVRPEWIPSA